MKKSLLSLVLAASSVSAGGATETETVLDSWLSGDYLTGDWNGSRTELEDKGYRFFGYYNAIVASNVSGGIDQRTEYAGDLYAGVQLDLGKSFGWDGWTFNLTGIDRHGDSIDDAVRPHRSRLHWACHRHSQWSVGGR